MYDVNLQTHHISDTSLTYSLPISLFNIDIFETAEAWKTI